MGLLHEALTGDYRVHGDPRRAEVITALSFGMVTNGDCESNIALAQTAINLAEEYDLTVIAQREVASAMLGKGALRYLEHTAEPDPKKKDAYFDTGHVLDIARGLHVTGAHLLVAHAFHMPRTDAMAQRRGMDTVVVPGMPTVWDRQSSQKWTRSPNRWRRREPAVLIEHKLKGKI